MCGHPLNYKENLAEHPPGRVQSCVRPVNAVLMTAGPDEIRGTGSNHLNVLIAPVYHGVSRSPVQPVDIKLFSTL